MGARLQAQGLAVGPDGRIVLAGLDLAVDRGWTAIVGPNGAGKSTLLRTLAGLLPPRAGTLRLDDRPLAAWPARERARRIAWMAQQTDAHGELTVQDVVRLGRLPHLGLFAEPGPADEAVVRQAMADTGCEAWAHRRLSALSGGERQRVLLARALAVQAPLLLLDEPTAHLDPPHQVALVRLMARLGRERGVVSVLHDLSLALAADRLAVVADGRLRALGPPAEAAVRDTLEAVFGGAIRIERTADGWAARPRLHP